jgi:oligopeptide/dipeptide ABC transporter ATP-binding protein
VANGSALLEVRDLAVHFSGGRRGPTVRAVEGVSFDVGANETVSVVGESGSGKTTLARAIAGLVRVTEGSIRFNGDDVTYLAPRKRAPSQQVQMVFQDPYSSLNPARTVGSCLLDEVKRRDRRQVRPRQLAEDMLTQTGLSARTYDAYPRKLSGGQRQRASIARALIVPTGLLICDEPVTALDLSVQAQILNMLKDLQAEYGMSFLFISHDLDVVRYMSHRVLVMYRGRVMEEGPVSEVAGHPSHPYTKLLHANALNPGGDHAGLGDAPPAKTVTAPSIPNDLSGCVFAARCPFAREKCSREVPDLRDLGSVKVACHFAEQIN